MAVWNNFAVNGDFLVGSPSTAAYGAVTFGQSTVTNQTFSGNVNVQVGAGTNNNFLNNNRGSLILGPGVAIHGKYAQFANGTVDSQIINQGSITADVAG